MTADTDDQELSPEEWLVRNEKGHIIENRTPREVLAKRAQLGGYARAKSKKEVLEDAQEYVKVARGNFTWETADQNLRDLALRAAAGDLKANLEFTKTWYIGPPGEAKIEEHDGYVRLDALDPFVRELVTRPAYASAVKKLLLKNSDPLLQRMREEKRRRNLRRRSGNSN